MSFDPNKIPLWLRRTPEQQAADQALQERLRQAQGPGRRPNPTEAHLIRAEAMKRAAFAQLEHLTTDPEAKPEHITAAEAQAAEALAMEGHFDDAAQLHPDPEHAARFQAIAEAIDRDDNEQCDCPVTSRTDPATGAVVTIPPNTITEMVFSPKHGKLTPLIRCRCGDLNVRPASQHQIERLDRVRQVRNENRTR